MILNKQQDTPTNMTNEEVMGNSFTLSYISDSFPDLFTNVKKVTFSCGMSQLSPCTQEVTSRGYTICFSSIKEFITFFFQIVLINYNIVKHLLPDEFAVTNFYKLFQIKEYNISPCKALISRSIFAIFLFVMIYNLVVCFNELVIFNYRGIDVTGQTFIVEMRILCRQLVSLMLFEKLSSKKYHFVVLYGSR